MENFRVSVYAICKNEAKFADRWFASMREADDVFVLDTGSDDGSAQRLASLGARVTTRRIEPWRFDVARNASLDLLPDDVDICVCTDLDEVFHPGWRAAVERAWATGTDRLRYRYTWNFNPDGSEGYVFWIDKIHARRGFRWVHPVHEVLQFEHGTPRTVEAEGVQLDHHADPEKSRAQYLPLLELAVREDPNDDRNLHYLGREYLFRGDWQRCIATLTRHLALPNAVWKDERAASMRYLARACEALGRVQDAESWLLRAVAEAPGLREPWLDLAAFLFRKNDWAGTLFAVEAALRITERPRTYISEAQSWGSLPHDLASIACYHLGLFDRAVAFADAAVRLCPADDRLRENRALFVAAERAALPPRGEN